MVNKDKYNELNSELIKAKVKIAELETYHFEETKQIFDDLDKEIFDEESELGYSAIVNKYNKLKQKYGVKDK